MRTHPALIVVAHASRRAASTFVSMYGGAGGSACQPTEWWRGLHPAATASATDPAFTRGLITPWRKPGDSESS
jgi:hypothetical protein